MQQKRSLQIIIGVLLFLVLGTTTVLIPYLIRQRELAEESVGAPEVSYAWKTQQSADSACIENTATIGVTFTNTEPNEPQWTMNVVATDQQTNRSTDLGTVNPGETKTGVINTQQSSLNSGQVKFELTWSDGHSGK